VSVTDTRRSQGFSTAPAVYESMREALSRAARSIRERYRAVRRRLRRLERRELREFRGWIENTDNLLHVSVLVFAPLLIGVVTYVSNVLPVAAFLLFPPLASGTFTLFADPESEYSSPGKFVAGMTLGALMGWIALTATTALWYEAPAGPFQVQPGAAALGVFLTGVVTWALDLEEPTAFSTALLVLLVGGGEVVPGFGTTASGLAYVAGVAGSSSFVAVVFAIWHDRIYEERARYLYQTTKGDDHVLVPMVGATAEHTATFGARIAGAHDAGKVVLLGAAGSEAADPAPEGETATAARGGDPTPSADAVADELEAVAGDVETAVGVPCEVVVAEGELTSGLVLDTASAENCDLVVTPYEERHGSLSPFVKRLFDGSTDVVAFRSRTDRSEWRRALVAVARAGENAHAMLDFGSRVVGRGGRLALCTCIDDERERRRAEETLATLAETFAAAGQTIVARTTVERFLAANADNYDLVVVGASTDRTAASRFISPPTFERLSGVETDVAIVHRGA